MAILEGGLLGGRLNYSGYPKQRWLCDDDHGGDDDDDDGVAGGGCAGKYGGVADGGDVVAAVMMVVVRMAMSPALASQLSCQAGRHCSGGPLTAFSDAPSGLVQPCACARADGPTTLHCIAFGFQQRRE